MLLWNAAVVGLLASAGPAWGQVDINVDSLERTLRNTREPLNRLELHCWLSRSNESHTAEHHAAITIALADSLLAHGYTDNPDILTKKASGMWALAESRYEPAGKPDSALMLYAQARDLWERNSDQERTAFANVGLGIFYRDRGDYARALEYFFAAAPRGSIPVDPAIRHQIAKALYNIAMINLDLGQPDSALSYYQRSASWSSGSSRPGFACSSWCDAAELLRAKGDVQGASAALDSAQALMDPEQRPTDASVVFTCLAAHLLEEGKPDSALSSAIRGVTLAEREADPNVMVFAQWSLAAVLTRLGRHSEALNVLLTAQALCNTQVVAVRERRNVAQMLADVYIQLDRPREALEAYQNAIALKDSMNSALNQSKLRFIDLRRQQEADSLKAREQRMAMEFEHREQLVAEQNRKRSLVFAAVAVLLVAGGLWYRLRFTRRAKVEADRLRERAEASERFKQQFLANMSHEIRTPMNAIMGMTGILKRNEQLPEQRKYLDAIAQSSENLLVILNDILDLSKLEAGKIDLEKVAFDPRQVIGNVRDILRFKAEEKGIALHTAIGTEVPDHLQGDPTRLNQIVLNLAGNAVKFTEQGSVTIAAQWSGDSLSIAVTDTGIGIPANRLNKIFEEFTQAYSDTTRKYGGTGLGLTISKRLAELQGGTIKVKSEQRKGSTFTVSIPYALADGSGANVHVRAEDHQPEQIALRDLRILLAEDNDFNAMVAQDELSDAIPGVHVDVATNGRMAVEMAQAKDYDVILMDVQMPEMNGYDATKAIRALAGDKSRIPIVAMTANVMKEEVERCLEAGMDGYVPKPFKREELMGALQLAKGPSSTRH